MPYKVEVSGITVIYVYNDLDEAIAKRSEMEKHGATVVITETQDAIEPAKTLFEEIVSLICGS